MDALHKDALLIAIAIVVPGLLVAWMLLRIKEKLDEMGRK